MAAVIPRNDLAFDEALLDRASVAFGVFDGVHEGHRFIIGEAVNTAREEGRASAVITFDIDPDEVFAADRLKKLMTNEARIAKLAELDVDAVVVLPFSREFAAQSPEDFLNACFGGGVPSHIHIGSDFHFGRKASGNVESLRVWGAERMEVHGHELVAEGGRPVTATRIRGLLSEGRAREAADLLGRPYELSGLVRPGRGEGRDFGFATAKLEVPPMLLAVGEGVYACYAVVNGARYKAAVNVGVPATFADTAKENEKLREALAQADAGNQETQALVDAVLTAVVLEHGERAMDPDAPETALGWRLAVPFFSVKEMREKYEIHARRGEDGKYILGVMERRSDL